MSDKDISIHITTGSIVRTLLLGILLTLLWFLRDLVLIVLSAVVIASAVEPGVFMLMKYKVKRFWAIVLVYLTILTLFSVTLFFFIPPVLNDAAILLERLPNIIPTLNISDITHGVLPWGNVSENISSSDLLNKISTTLSDSTSGVFTTLSAFFGGVLSFILIVVFAIYFSAQETGVDDFLRIITPVEYQVYVLSLWKRTQDKIGKWMQGQIVLAVLVGVFLYLGLVILGVPNPLMLAVIAAVFELIPVFGQILAAIPAVAVAFVSGGTSLAFLVIMLYLIVQQFEAHLIYPLVVKKVVGIPPIVVILALLVGFKLVGFLGVLLAVPIAGAIQEYVSDVDQKKTRALARKGLTPEGDEK